MIRHRLAATRPPQLTRMAGILLLLTLLGSFAQSARPAGAFYRIFFVNAAAGAGGTGSSWASAYRDLSSALAVAEQGDAIWVAAGVYRPTTGADRTATFTIKTGVAVYGGFAGTETALGQRNWMTNVVTLSGDLLGNDVGFANNGENSYHVVSGQYAIGRNPPQPPPPTFLDGVTITGGNANGAFPHNAGGGIFKYAGDFLYNVTITGNAAINGGGMANEGSIGQLMYNVTISGNQAINQGGGIYSTDATQITLESVTISGNTARSGGGMANIDNPFASSMLLKGVTFSGNAATHEGGGIYNSNSKLELTNVTLRGNTAQEGAAVWNSSSSPVLTNVVISGNSATTSGGGLFNTISSPVLTNVTISGNSGGGIANTDSSQPQIRNSIVWANSSGISNTTASTATISFSLIQGSGGSAAWNGSAGIDGGGNLDADPQFVSPVPAAPSLGGDLHLLPTSPAINAGSNTVSAPGLPATDADGHPRIGGGRVDMGAYEYHAARLFMARIGKN
jgi:predicted outer membrane repeat protein